MSYALYICGDEIGSPGGAGQVTKHELAVMQRMYPEVVALQLRHVQPGPYAGLDVPFLWDYFALAQVAKLCESKGPPVHCHIYSGCYTETIRYLKTYMCHDTEGFYPAYTQVSITVPAHDRNLSIKERGPAYYLPHIDIPELWAQHSEGYKLADLVIVPGEAPRRFLEREGVDPKRLAIIPHGISRYPETVLPFPDRFIVGYLGAYGPDKGVKYLLQAWGAVAPKMDPDAELWLAGAGSEGLEKLVRQYVPSGKVRLLGFVDDPWEFYQHLSVYVQPSVCEGFGIEVAEAMACGRPCIVSTGAGAADLTKQAWANHDGVTGGYKVPPADVERLVGMIDLFYAVFTQPKWKEQRIRYGVNAREVARRLTWDQIEAQYEAIFHNRLGI